MQRLHEVDRLKTADIVVCGAHMSGMELSWQLTEHGVEFKELTTTEHYGPYKIADNGVQRRHWYKINSIIVPL